MAGLVGGGGGSSKYTYVQDATPTGAEQSETWYTVNGNADYDPGAYVYDGSTWVATTVTDHEQLGNVTGMQHHQDGVEHPVYASTADVPSGLPQGTVVYVQGDGLYVEDGT